MRTAPHALGLSVALAAAGMVFAAAPSPCAGEQDREIKALSATEIAGLREGRGMGYARAAGRDGHPGPGHVLELVEAYAALRGCAAPAR